MKPTEFTSFTRAMITITVMLVAVLEVLDMTIVNVALPAMMGNLGTNSDQITWVLTSYIVSSAILMPMTGFLVERLGRKRLLLMNIVGFFAASMLCGFATNLTQIVAFRTMQGLFGAALVPLAQYILRDTYPKEEHGKAMAIWGIGIMAGPILGPTIGGYITDALTWRWVFFINAPVCIIAFFMALKFVIETPRKKIKIDWIGIVLLTVGVGALQIFLDRGNSEGWFDAKVIQALFATWVLAISFFIIRGVRVKNSIINLRLYLNRNFLIGELLITFYVMSMLGLIAIQPIMLENLLGYPVTTTGLLMAPRGFASALGMVVVSLFINRSDSRVLLAIGIALSGIGTYAISLFNLNTNALTIMWTGAVQGFGMGFFFVPLSTITFVTLDKESIPEATGLFSFARSIGSSIGISIFATMVSHQSQINWQELSAHVSPFSRNLTLWLNHPGWQLQEPQAISSVVTQISRQASMIAYNDTFWMVSFIFFALLPLVFFLENGKPDEALAVH